MQRRTFLRRLVGASILPGWGLPIIGAQESAPRREETAIRERLEAHRPSRMTKLPPDFNDRLGAAHVDGKYFFTDKPFLLEGAERLLALGTRVGKFWFMPGQENRNYRFHHRWTAHQTLSDLARSEAFAQLFALPFTTFVLEAFAPKENGWRAEKSPEYYEAVQQEYFDVTSFFYRQFHDRPVTVILQHWEGDWMLRGRGGESWNPPPPDWPVLAERMQRWLAARQAGVTRARRERGAGTRCRVVHAAEVNRVMDIAQGLPTVTDKVLPEIDLDLVSYSAYDGLKDPFTLWRCMEEIRKHARTTGPFGPKALYLGEIGLPENESSAAIAETWDGWLGAALAAGALYVLQWELYCNEINPRIQPPPQLPVKENSHLRGFWLVRPDGSLSQTGNYLGDLWRRGMAAR